MYFDKSKIRIASKLESKYDVVIKDYNNFNYNYQDRLGKIKIDTLFKKWRAGYEFSLQADKKNVFLGSIVKSRKKNFGHYELEVDNKVIWDGIILATKTNLFKKFNRTYIGQKYFSDTLSCLLYTSPSPRDQSGSRMPSSA